MIAETECFLVHSSNLWRIIMTYFHLVSEPNGFLSNWYPSEFALKDIVFTCIEQYDVKESYHFW